MVETNAAIKMVENQKIIKKINKKFTPTQPVESCSFDKITDTYQNAFVNTMKGIGRLILAVWNVLFIVPAIAIGLLEGISQGLLKGLQRATAAYENRIR